MDEPTFSCFMILIAKKYRWEKSHTNKSLDVVHKGTSDLPMLVSFKVSRPLGGLDGCVGQEVFALSLILEGFGC